VNLYQESGPVPGAGTDPESTTTAGASAESALPPAAEAPDIGQPEPPRAETGPDYKDRWLRAEAELQNYRKRVQREFEETRRGAEEGALLELLPVLDDLERALAGMREAGAPDGWTQGVTLTAQRMRDALGRLGVEVVDPAGQPFDPAFHEAVLEMPAPEGVAAGTVLQVAQKGYRRGERALRAARVVVARADGPS
jgi:molecular chaperone GrpE